MTPRFKVALGVLGALLLATGTLAILLGPAPGRRGSAGTGTEAVERADIRDPQAPPLVRTNGSGEGASLQGTGEGGLPEAGPGGVVPGLRVPEGIDLTDQGVVRDLITQLLARDPVDWEELAKAVALLRGPLDAESQDRLLEEIRAGNRLGAVRVFEALHDGTIVPNLFDLLDDPDLPAPARQAVLQALYSIPGADGGEVVRGLESRITGDPRGDMSILRAIAMRGGREGTRALIEHVQRTKDLQRVPAYVLQGLDLEREPGGGTELVAEALRTSAAPNVLRALLDMAARPGVEGLAEPLIALDREGMPDDIRQQALLSLARNGTDTAVRHLLGVSSQPDAQGEMAVRALGSMQNATPAARDELLRALQTADRSPRPDVARQNLLLALGSLKHIPALPEMAASLRSTVPQVRLAAVRGLGHLGAPARVHAGELVGLYADGDDTLKRHVIMALGTIGGETAASALGQIRSDPKVPASIRRTADAAWQQVVGELEQPDVGPSESADPTLVGSPSPGGSVPSR